MKYYERDDIIYDLRLSEKWYDISSKIDQLFQYIYKDKEELFFHFFKEYGGEYVDDDITKYRKLIPEYFHENGKFETKHKQKKRIIANHTQCAVGCLPNINETYYMIPYFCDYYLETIIFAPNKDFLWDDFTSDFYDKAISRNLEAFIANGYTDLIFAKTDGGNVNIVFSNKIDRKNLLSKISDLL